MKVVKVPEGEIMANGDLELAKIIVVTDGGPWAKHNMPCAVCGKEKAVLDLSGYYFQPCWACQKLGWELSKK